MHQEPSPAFLENGVHYGGNKKEDNLHDPYNQFLPKDVAHSRILHDIGARTPDTLQKYTQRRLAILTTVTIGAILLFCVPEAILITTRQRLYTWFAQSQKAYSPREGFKDAVTRPEDISNNSHTLAEIPQYVLDFAPLVHLYSEEQFWPCDIAEHLSHITPDLDYAPIEDLSLSLNLTNLDNLNQYDKGRHVYLTSNDNVEQRPDWLGGQKNIPDDIGEDGEGTRTGKSRFQSEARKTEEQTHGGRSDAPAVLVVVDKGHGTVDAFWFYFYSYNLGNVVFNVRFGNHVGDWEHTLIRFHHGMPKLVFFSEHNFGAAYTYEAVEKIGIRPVVYSATGTHAMYATPGSHPYILPLGILHDETDRGPLWDPALNSHMYNYNHLNDELRASSMTPSAPTQWFYFAGRWGDKFYPYNDDRQYGFLGEYHYVSGPLGPRFKNLGRRNVCQGRYTDPCIIKDELDLNEVRVWPGLGNGEEEPDFIPFGESEGGD